MLPDMADSLSTPRHIRGKGRPGHIQRRVGPPGRRRSSPGPGQSFRNPVSRLLSVYLTFLLKYAFVSWLSFTP